MTPLEQFAHALEETAFPAADMIDSGFPPRDVQNGCTTLAALRACPDERK